MFDPQAMCQNMPTGFIVVCYLGYLAFEWGLGKTKYGSTLGLLVEHPISSVLAWIKGAPKQ